MIMLEPAQTAIWHCLNHYAYSDAVFLAERLYAEVETDDSLFLLATAYYRWGKPYQAYSVLKGKPSIPRHPQCRFLLARCAMDLKRYSEAESILCGNPLSNKLNLDQICADFGEESSFALQLLATVFSKSERTHNAAEAFHRALKRNPLLWSCFTDLCNLGEKPDAHQVFQITNLCQNVQTTVEDTNCDNSVINSFQTITPENLLIPRIPTSENEISPITSTNKSSLYGPYPYPYLSPNFGVQPLEASTPNVELLSQLSTQNALTEANDQKSLAKRVRAQVGQFMNRRETPLQLNKPTVFSQAGHNTATPVTTNVRRSSRLFSNSNSVKENNKSPNRGKFVTPKSPSRKSKQRLAKSNINKNTFSDMNVRNLQTENERVETITKNSISTEKPNNVTNAANVLASLQVLRQCTENILSLYRNIGQAYQHLANFNCRKAIECFQQLPPHHYYTSWVLSMLALAHFELSEYEQSVNYFKEVHEREPYRLELMEIYSTALWHLQKEVALSALAQDLVSLDKNSPISWCVAGNCFSLQKEHDTAIKLFQRAVQLQPDFANAYNLLGHEYVTTEELDKAMGCFRSALRLDTRHYKAWFGIATVYSKQELFRLAEYHYKRALSINPQSSVILCHIGVAQHALKKTDAALKTLNVAISANPNNPLTKFHRASIYFAAGRHAEALEELEELKKVVPKEALVYYLIGKIHKKLGNTHLALMHFSWATDLDPKGANNQIKEAIEPALGDGSCAIGSPVLSEDLTHMSPIQSSGVLSLTDTPSPSTPPAHAPQPHSPTGNDSDGSI